ncbi:hypothetical protein GO009_01600 [Muricauda sp. TY007]|uniref:AbiH family protein n=1 Tax=Allomuricauda sp. TY007 TaxID=2683200 RepID=UPI0013BEF557|nr:AbiH family protein [Muricauda sp. TY007]NDV14705.1 hypothetical protein [Muricauda sp. TY007]
MDENSKLNRIILIGNGFDRSLGMPTSYSHFLDWIFQEALKELHSKAMKSHGLLRSSHLHSFENDLLKLEVTTGNLMWIESLINNKRNYREYLSERDKLKNRPYFHFNLKTKYEFINELLSFYNLNSWVDIEQVYFKRLLETSEKNIKEFHQNFDLLKQELLKYLKTLEINKDKGHVLMSKYRKHFFGKILQYDSSLKIYEETDKNPAHFYFVNFNYTNFLSLLMDYAPEYAENENTINHIHGDLNGFPIIFGYGNETGENYSKLESLGNNYLENIKSTHYFNSTHYKDLEVQLNSPYEVYVYGLSCGLSDQILLNTIMQKDNCKQIRIFYNKYEEGNGNYREILMNISRVFDDKEVMRSKIISKQKDDYIRQIKTEE